MKNPSQEDLLGYVLGALDAQEQSAVQDYIDQHPAIEEELLQIKNSLLPLECISDPSGPPIGLARRTCEFVSQIDRYQPEGHYQRDTNEDKDSSHQETVDHSGDMKPAPEQDLRSDSTQATLPVSELSASSDQRNQSKFLRSWAHTDFLALTAALLILAGILFPSIQYVRNNSQIVACKGNLRSLGMAFLEFSTLNPDGKFVEIPNDKNLGVSGIYAPVLKNAGLIIDEDIRCQGVSSESITTIPSLEQIANATGEQLRFLHKTMGGSYGYSLGYAEENQYQARKNQGRAHILLLADLPSSDLEGRRSSNHGGTGQNCLFEDGHVDFVRGHAIGHDPIFENDLGLIGTGLHDGDNVIAPSHIPPVIFEVRRLNAPFGPLE